MGERFDAGGTVVTGTTPSPRTIRTVTAVRYVEPLREGGSLPAIVEGDDGRLYAMKFRGAGQGVKQLIAELLAGEVARELGLLVPELVFVTLDPVLGRTERDPEIQDLIRASGGLNLGLAFLSGAITYSPLLEPPAADLASRIVWFDALVTNVDRTARNTNLLRWHEQLWLIDHGSSLYFHHGGWEGYRERARAGFRQIKDHVLLPYATTVEAVDEPLAARLPPPVLREIAALLPADWLDEPGTSPPPSAPPLHSVERGLEGEVATEPATPEERRAAYAEYLAARLVPPRPFLPDILGARRQPAPSPVPRPRPPAWLTRGRTPDVSG